MNLVFISHYLTTSPHESLILYFPFIKFLLLLYVIQISRLLIYLEKSTVLETIFTITFGFIIYIQILYT